MKNLLILLSLITLSINAQTNLKYDKRYIQCEDKWIAKQMDKDSTYVLGFIYIDAAAGLTLNYEGKFKIINNVFVRQNEEMSVFKVRLEPNRIAIAEIPEDRFNELGILKFPEWLTFYKENENSIERLYRWGFLYNGWDECAKALTYLEKAEKINPKYKGLEVELAYSYNCLSNYDKAVLVLQSALEANPADAYVNKELIYAQIKSGQLDKAAESFKKASEICNDKTYNGENCYNLLQAFYTNKDKLNFNLWLDDAKKLTSGNAVLTKNILAMEDQMSK
ncbi:MAG: tetratricopeptide repeat protein [Paludibacter sp.]|nr:tetratricopeptide repeat protein [Paludibacter sp.]